MSENERTIYHIYGRTTYTQPLQFVQTASREDLTVPEGKEWVEVIAFPETAVIQVIPRPFVAGTSVPLTGAKAPPTNEERIM
jgi:hypothetical protein